MNEIQQLIADLESMENQAIHPRDSALRRRAAQALRDLQCVVSTSLTAKMIEEFHEWTIATFGHGKRTAAIVDHIRKELKEIASDPEDAMEYIDAMMLALNGPTRLGLTGEQVTSLFKQNFLKNKGRDWPDWRRQDPSKAIEHNRCCDAND